MGEVMVAAVVQATEEDMGGPATAEAVQDIVVEIQLTLERKTGILSTVPEMGGNLHTAVLPKRKWVVEYALGTKYIIEMVTNGIIVLVT